MSPTSYRTAPPRAKTEFELRISKFEFLPCPLDFEFAISPFFQIRNSKSLLVGLGRVELPTSRLSGVRSNQLSYRPPGLLCAIRAPIARSWNSIFQIQDSRYARGAYFNAKKSHTSLCGPLANGGHAGGPCSFGG